MTKETMRTEKTKTPEEEGRHEEDLNEGSARRGVRLATPALGISDTCFYRIKVLRASPAVHL